MVSMVGHGIGNDSIHAPFRLLQDAIDALVREGVFSKSGRPKLCLPIYRRTLAEVTAPFDHDNVLASELLLELESATELDVDCPLFAQFQQDSDVASFATRYVNFIRAFTESVVSSSMPECQHGNSQVDAIYDRMTELVSANPHRYRLTRSQILVVARKR